MSCTRQWPHAPITLPLPAQLESVASWGVPCDKSDEGGNCRLGLSMGLYNMLALPKVDGYSIAVPPWGMALKGRNEGKSSHWADVWIYIDWGGAANGLAGCSRLRRIMIRKLVVTRRSEKDFCMWNSLNMNRVLSQCVPVNDHHTEISSEENLNKQVDEMTCVWKSVSPFPQLLLSYSNENQAKCFSLSQQHDFWAPLLNVPPANSRAGQ